MNLAGKCFRGYLRDDVAAIYENMPLQANLSESLSQIGQPLTRIDGHTGKNTTVAVLDTGVDYTRAAFGSCTAPGQPGCRVVSAIEIGQEDNLLDGNGHGTNVAGIVAGVAPGASILSMDICDGNSEVSSTFNVIRAVNMVISMKEKYNIVAINLSFSELGTAYSLPCSKVFGSESCQGITVDAVASLSNSSRHVFNGFLNFTFAFPSLLAPGCEITAAGITGCGTSMAAPHVSGAIAVLRAEDVAPDDTIEQTVIRLRKTGVLVTDTRNGARIPRIDLYMAVKNALDERSQINITPIINPVVNIY